MIPCLVSVVGVEGAIEGREAVLSMEGLAVSCDCRMNVSADARLSESES